VTKVVIFHKDTVRTITPGGGRGGSGGGMPKGCAVAILVVAALFLVLIIWANMPSVRPETLGFVSGSVCLLFFAGMVVAAIASLIKK
jgi:hypothetical protein